LFFVQFPFITAPIFLALFAFGEKDLVNLLFGSTPTIAEQCNVRVVFGGIILIVAFIVDRQKFQKDFAFWGYLFGVASFWGGLSVEFSNVYQYSGTFKFVYFLVNVAMLFAALYLQRIIFLLTGGVGTAAYVVQLLMIYGTPESNSYLSVILGVILIGSGYYVDIKKISPTYPFWAYLFGCMIYWGGFAVLFFLPVFTGPVFAFIYFLTNVILAILYIPTKQPEFIAFGGAGVLVYVNYLLQTYLQSYALPIIVTIVGLALIALAVYCSRSAYYRRKKEKKMREDEEVTQLLSDVEMTNTQTA